MMMVAALLDEIERRRHDDWVVWLNMTGRPMTVVLTEDGLASSGMIRIAPRRELAGLEELAR